MKDLNILKRFALLYHFSFLLYPLAKLRFAQKNAQKLELTNFRAMYKTFYRIVLLMNI